MTDLAIPGAADGWMRHQQLAFACSPMHTRAGVATLFLFDGLMGHLSLGTAEPMLARIKLAWWRDEGIDSEALSQQFRQEVTGPLTPLAQMKPWLLEIIDAWDGLIANWPPKAEDLDAYAQKRGRALSGALFELHGLVSNGSAQSALANWALIHLAHHTGTADVSVMALEHLKRAVPPEGEASAAPAACRVLASLGNGAGGDSPAWEWFRAMWSALFQRGL